MRLPLPVGLSGFTTRFYYVFLTLCGVGESGSPFFVSCFLSMLGLAWARALSSLIRPLFPFIVGLWAD